MKVYRLSSLSLCFAIILTLICFTSCMRIDPSHPYDPESPPEYRAPSSLLSALYSSEIPPAFDYSVFIVDLVAVDFDVSYSQRVDLDGRFSFQGVMPGRYYLSTRGEVMGELYGIQNLEVFLPVGEVVDQTFFDLSPLD